MGRVYSLRVSGLKVLGWVVGGGSVGLRKKVIKLRVFSKGNSLQVAGCWFRVFLGFVRVSGLFRAG